MNILELTDDELDALKDHMGTTRDMGVEVLKSHMHAEMDGKENPEELKALADNFAGLTRTFESMADKVEQA